MIKFRRCIPLGFSQLANLQIQKNLTQMSDFSGFCQIFWAMSDFLKNPAVGEALHPRGIEISQKVGKCDSLTFRTENLSRRAVSGDFGKIFGKKSDTFQKI